MANNATIAISVLADTKKFSQGMKDASSATDVLSKGAKGLGIAVAAGLGLAAIGIGKVAADAFKAVAEMQRLTAQTEAVLASTGGAAGKTLAEITGLADSIERLTGIQAENVIAGQNMLLTFTNINGANFDRATRAVVDLSVAMGTDTTAAATMLGKALNDPIAGISSLSRVGIQFTDVQKEQIALMVAQGDTAGAQAIILGEVERQFAGSAEAFGATFLGGVEKIKNAFGEITEALVMGVMPTATLAVQTIATRMQEFADSPAFQMVVAKLESWGTAFATLSEENGILATLGYFIENFTVLGVAIQWVRDNQDEANGIFTTFKDALLEIWDAIVASGLLTALQDLGTELGGALYDAITELAPHIPTIATALKDVLLAVIPLLPEIVDLVAELLPLFDVIVDLVAEDVLPLLVDVIEDLTPVVEDAVPVVGELADVLGKMVGVVGPAVDLLGSLFAIFDDDGATTEDLNGIVDAIEEFADSVDWFYSFFGIDFPGMLETAEVAAKGFADFIFGTLIPALEDPEATIKDVWTEIQKWLSTTISDIKDDVTTFVDDVKTKISDGFGMLPKIVSDAWEFILYWIRVKAAQIQYNVAVFVEGVKGFFRDLGTIMSNTIRDAIEFVVFWFRSLPIRIQAAFFGAISWLYNSGQNIVQGLINGINSIGGGVVNAIVNMVNNATGGGKRALGINSPSRVFRSMGLSIGEGLVLGIRDSRAGVLTALTDLTGSMESGFNPSLTYADTPAYAGAYGAARANVTINVDTLQDGPEIGRRIKDSLDEYYRIGGR